MPGANPFSRSAAPTPDSVFGKAKQMVFPRVVLAGHGVLEELATTCRQLGFGDSGSVITGPKTAVLAGNRATEILAAEGFRTTTVVAHEATEPEVARVEAEVRNAGARFVVGVGGGSKIDITKVVAHRLGLPFLSLPTSAAHDGISSPRASLHGSENVASTQAAPPMGVIADTKLIVQAPFRLLASGCADVISNVTAILDWKLAMRLRSEEYSSTAAALSEYAAREIMDHAPSIQPNLEESVWIAIRPILVAGIAMSVAGSSRPCSGSEHLFSHALDRLARRPSLHGEQCGVGSIMMMYLHGGDWRQLKNALMTVGAPTTASELGVTPEEVVRALELAHSLRPDRYTILGDNGLTREAAERLAAVTGVLG